jgi:hypothetical protein
MHYPKRKKVPENLLSAPNESAAKQQKTENSRTGNCYIRRVLTDIRAFGNCTDPFLKG